jgi:hypothetical protein
MQPSFGEYNFTNHLATASERRRTALAGSFSYPEKPRPHSKDLLAYFRLPANLTTPSEISVRSVSTLMTWSPYLQSTVSPTHKRRCKQQSTTVKDSARVQRSHASYEDFKVEMISLEAEAARQHTLADLDRLVAYHMRIPIRVEKELGEQYRGFLMISRFLISEDLANASAPLSNEL